MEVSYCGPTHWLTGSEWDTIGSNVSESHARSGEPMAQVRLGVLEAQEELPMVCMVCGKPAAGVRITTLSSGFVLNAPLCAVHANHWRNRFLFRIIGFFAMGILFLVCK